MILRIALAALLSLPLSGAAAAQSFSYQRCDLLAGHPQEPGHEGRGVEWDRVDAAPALAACRAALAESPDAPEVQYRLARTLMQVKRYAEAFPMMLEAAEAGYGPAQTAYGTAYLGNQGVEVDYAVAFEWLTRAAEANHPIGQFNLGLMFDEGWGMPADFQQAEILYMRSAEQGYPRAIQNLGLLYERGEVGVPRNWEASFALFQRAERMGIAPALTALARAHAYGRGTPQDDAEAFRWWSRAAAAGYANANLEVARALLNGHGVEADTAAATQVYRHAATSGYTPAQVDLGRLLLSESGDAAQIAEGIDWLKRAGEAGNLEGYQYLAEHYSMTRQFALSRHYAEIVARNGNDQLKGEASSLLDALAGLEANRRKALDLEPRPGPNR